MCTRTFDSYHTIDTLDMYMYRYIHTHSRQHPTIYHQDPLSSTHDQDVQSYITEEDAREQIHPQIVMIGPSDQMNLMEKISHREAFSKASTFPYLMRSIGAGGLKCFNPKEDQSWSSARGDHHADRVQLMGMLFFATTKCPLKSTGWVVSDEAKDKHKNRLAVFM